MTVREFRIQTDNVALEDLSRRLDSVRWSDAVTDDWSYGTHRPTLERVIGYWRSEYDWREREEALNHLPHFRAEIGGFGIHFLHFRGKGPEPHPLLLMNGWPSSFVEYDRLVPLLTASAAGAPGDSFDVVIPTLPGFGFSDRPSRPRQVNPTEIFHRLMTEALGFGRFAAAGSDLGARTATRLALRDPDRVNAIHVATVDDPVLADGAPPLTGEEQAYLNRLQSWSEREGAYASLQATKPQTLAFALADSPVGLASWIIEKFHGWSDHSGDLFEAFPPETLVDNLMIYWLTQTIGSSMRLYYERPWWRPPHPPGTRVAVPTGVLMLPRDLVTAPREWAERFYNVRRFTRAERGGHFPAWEVPELYARELRETLLP